MKTVSFDLYELEDLKKIDNDLAEDALLRLSNWREEKESVEIYKVSAEIRKILIPALEKEGFFLPHHADHGVTVEYQGPDEASFFDYEDDLNLFIFLEDKKLSDPSLMELRKIASEWDLTLHVHFWMDLKGNRCEIQFFDKNKYIPKLRPIIKEALVRARQSIRSQIDRLIASFEKLESWKEEDRSDRIDLFFPDGTSWEKFVSLNDVAYHVQSKEPAQKVPASAAKKRVAR